MEYITEAAERGGGRDTRGRYPFQKKVLADIRRTMSHHAESIQIVFSSLFYVTENQLLLQNVITMRLYIFAV